MLCDFAKGISYVQRQLEPLYRGHYHSMPMVFKMIFICPPDFNSDVVMTICQLCRTPHSKQYPS